jgi:hypothetical protein
MSKQGAGLIVFLVLLAFGIAFYGINNLTNKVDKLEKTKTTIIEEKDSAEDKNKQLEKQLQEKEEQRKAIEAEKDALQKEVETYRSDVKELQDFLASKGSPMAPSAKALYVSAKRYGHDPKLLVAIAGVESCFGKRCYGHNPFGYLKSGAGSGLREYSSWAAGYEATAKFIAGHWGGVQSSSRMHGYCVPSHPWMEKVAGIQRSI